MAILWTTGVDERIPLTEDFDAVNSMSGVSIVQNPITTPTDPYLAVGSCIQLTGNSASSRRLFRKNLPSPSDTMVVGYMLQLNTSGVPETAPAARVSKGGATVLVERNLSTGTGVRIISTGMDGTDFDDVRAETWGGGLSNANWHPYAAVFRDLGEDGVGVTLLASTNIVVDVIYPDAQFPDGDWEWAEAGMASAQTASGSRYIYMDDIYFSDDGPRMGAKCWTLRPDAQGVNDDLTLSAGSSKPEALAEMPPDTATGVTGSSADKDTYEMDTLSDPTDATPYVHAVQLVGYGESVGPTINGIVRQGGTDYDIGEMPLGLAPLPSSAPIMNSQPSGGEWSFADVNSSEFGIVVN